MAKRETDSQDQRFPEWWRRKSLRGRVYEQNWRGVKVIRAWPKPKGPNRTPAEAQAESDFKKLAHAQMNAWPVDRVGAQAIAQGSQYTWRDVLGRAMVGRLIEIIPQTPEALDVADIQALLDSISDQPGAMLMRSPSAWVVLVNPLGEPDLIWDFGTDMPVWGTRPASAITELTGDGTAGPGAGSQVFTLASTTVTPGVYTLANVTVDSKGRITSASSGSAPSGITQLTGDATAGPGSGTQPVILASSGVAPGSYTLASVTVDAKGRVTSASSGSAPSGITQLTGDATAGPGSGTQPVILASSGVAPGSYTLASVTVDAKGRVTSAANGSAPSGITELTGDATAGPGSGTQPVILASSGVAPGSYTLASVTIDAKGRVTSATSGSAIPSSGLAQAGFAANRYYTALSGGPTTTGATTANTLYAVPLIVGKDTTFTKMAMVNGTIVASGHCELGIYANSDGVPGARLFDLGQVTTNATGKREITGATALLPAGIYWLAAGFDLVHSNVRMFQGSQGAQFNMLGQDSALSLTASLIGCSAAWTYSTGNLPNPFPTPTMLSTQVPTVYIGV
jgi:hypothetical protein